MSSEFKLNMRARIISVTDRTNESSGGFESVMGSPVPLVIFQFL